MTVESLSTSLAREAARAVRQPATTIEAIIADLDHVAGLEIDTAGARALAVELAEETGLLADVLDTKATAMELADSGFSTGGAYLMGELARLTDELSVSLGDGVGATGAPSETVLEWMQATGADGMTTDEFTALAADTSVPPHVRDAIGAMAAEPVVMANLDRAGWLLGAPGAVTTETMVLFVATQEVSRGLGDRGTFDAFDSAKNGKLDNRISWDDVHLIADDESADPSLRTLAFLLEGNPLVFRMLDTGTAASADERLDVLAAFADDGHISFGDAVASAVNMQSFDGRPGEARDFVMGLPSTNDFRDATGNILQIQWFSDSGVRHLATAALAAAPTLSQQVGVVGRLPESPGGVRNLAITEYYRRIGGELDRLLNPDGNGGALPLDAHGSTGANWFMHGAFASSEVRPILVDNQGFGPVTAGWAARQSMADGNQLLFDALAPAAAEFIDSFPPGSELTPAAIEEYFGELARPDGRPLFVDGDRQLRDGLALLLDAMDDPDPVTRQQTAFRSTLLIGVHEQALVDPFVDRAIDQGWDDGFRVLGDFFGDERIATGQVDPDLGDYHFDADEPLPVRHSHPDHVIGYDLTTTLNPVPVTTASINGVTFDLSGTGGGDVDLAGLEGWDAPPNYWDLEAQVIDPAEWHDEYGTIQEPTGPRGRIETAPGSSTGTPLPGYDELPGAAADNWTNYPDRMWTITNAFQQAHTLPSVAGIPGNGFDEADLSFLPESG